MFFAKMMNWCKALFRPAPFGMLVIGVFGDERGCDTNGLPLLDINQKRYRYHQLIEEGEFQGAYQAMKILGMAKPAVREQFEESVDLLNSGFSLCRFDERCGAFKLISWPAWNENDTKTDEAGF